MPLISKPGNAEECVLAVAMTIQAASNIITLASAVFPPETVYDGFLGEFRTIVNLSSSLYTFTKTASSGFQFPIATLPALMEVGLRCRDKHVRGQAIDLLLARPGYQEGVWHGMEMGGFLSLVRGIEETGIDESGYVPEKSRISWTGTIVNMEGRRTEVDYVQRSEFGTFVQKTITMYW
jgi:hypothetical protein